MQEPRSTTATLYLVLTDYGLEQVTRACQTSVSSPATWGADTYSAEPGHCGLYQDTAQDPLCTLRWGSWKVTASGLTADLPGSGAWLKRLSLGEGPGRMHLSPGLLPGLCFLSAML